jgi:hypothetical protein
LARSNNERLALIPMCKYQVATPFYGAKWVAMLKTQRQLWYHKMEQRLDSDQPQVRGEQQ